MPVMPPTAHVLYVYMTYNVVKHADGLILILSVGTLGPVVTQMMIINTFVCAVFVRRGTREERGPVLRQRTLCNGR